MSVVTCVDAKVLEDITIERRWQDAKWGEQNHGDLFWLGILVEEVGEIAQAIIQDIEEPRASKSFTRKELIETAAVVIAWLEAIARRKRLEKEA